MHLLIHWLTDSLNSCTESLIHSLNDSLIHWLIGSLFRWLIGSFCQMCMDSSCHFIGSSTTICSFVNGPNNFSKSLLLHRKKSYGHWFLITISFFRNFRPSGRALPDMAWILFEHHYLQRSSNIATLDVILLDTCKASIRWFFETASCEEASWGEPWFAGRITANSSKFQWDLWKFQWP